MYMSKLANQAIGILVSGIFMSACASSALSDPPPMPLTPKDFNPQELRRLERKADSGNGEAANRLSGYYGYVRFDMKKQRHWLERAAECGYKPAMETLVELLMESPRAKDRQRAAELIRKIKESSKGIGKKG
jgi:TPR repeat protein